MRVEISGESTGKRGVMRMALCLAVLVPAALLAASSALSATITEFGSYGGIGIAGFGGGGGAASGGPHLATGQAATIGWAADPPYCDGTHIAIVGSGFVNDGGVTGVTIGGAPAGGYTVGSDSIIYASVGADAKSGPVTVTTPKGTATSSMDETIVGCAAGPATAKPLVTRTRPAKVRPGRKVELIGSGLMETTGVTVDGARAVYAVLGDQGMYVHIPKTAKGTVTITVTNAAGSTSAKVVAKAA